MSRSRISQGVLFVAAILGAPMAAYAAITFQSLLSDLTDLERLTRTPNPAYITRQFSSYDRKSTDPNVATDDNWFANDDRGQFIRTEQRDGATEYVMMDADGPGAIVRIWSANPAEAGVIRIYLDGNATPAIELPFIEMLRGNCAPFSKPIACETSRGWNSYLPIPYAKHCKVTASKPKFYYHVNYRTYGPDIAVKTYAGRIGKRQLRMVNTIAEHLAHPAAASNPASPKTQAISYDIQPGSSVSGALTGNSRAIYAFVVKPEAADLAEALRANVLEIRFDGSPTPQVACPLGDFFATAPGVNPYQSLPSGVLDDGRLYSRWVMPFQRTAEFKITNTSSHPLTITGEFVTGAYRWSDESMYFHAKWRSEYPIKTRPRQDWNFLKAEGTGRFCGTMLHVTNPVLGWWGEGDEKIYVDGESFPSHFGTGSEDYFGYAWCSNVRFTHAYHNQPRCDGPKNYGQTCVSRFHIVDDIPFTKSFKFDMEAWHWEDCEVAMAETSYWYARSGDNDSFAPINVAELKLITPPPPPPPKK